jgi:hypothetical protein
MTRDIGTGCSGPLDGSLLSLATYSEASQSRSVTTQDAQGAGPPSLFLGFAIIWTGTTFFVTFNGYLKDRAALISGKANYVEGTVDNLVPMPYQGHARESFEVKGIRFNYSDYETTAASITPPATWIHLQRALR